MEIHERYEQLAKTILAEHQAVFKEQSTDELAVFLEAIVKAKRVFIVGAGREGIAARAFTMRIMHLGKECHWLWDDTTPGMGEGDLFIAVDGSGKIGHIDYLVKQAQKTGAAIAVVTGAPNEAIPSAADYCLFVPACVYKGDDPRTVPSIQPMGNLFEQHLFLLFDLMIILMQEEMALKPAQMEALHRNIE